MNDTAGHCGSSEHVRKKIICLIFNKLTDLLIWATNLEAQAAQLKCLGD